jgi:hypothetical protein
MLQELAIRTGAAAWAVASMLFFVAVWGGIAVWTLRARAEEMEARAHLALEVEADGRGGTESPRSGDTQA